MQTLLQAGVPVASSCHGDGVCAKCKVEVHQGQENLSAANEVELFLKEKNNLGSLYRISCQCKIEGDLQLNTGYW